MKTLIKITAILAISLGSLASFAQQSPMFTHYMYNTLLVNPAYAGSRDALTVTALGRSQWVGFDGAPKTQTLTMHAPVKNEHIGVGLSLMNDKIGPSNNTSINAHFAYIMNLTKKSKLSLGLSGGADIRQARLSTLNVDQQGDPSFQNNIESRALPNFGFGAYYSRERFYAGVSVPSLLQNNYSEFSLNDNTLISHQRRHYFFIAGAIFDLTPNLAFKPTTLLKVSAAVPAQADFTASFIIMQKLLLGAMFRSGDAFGALVGFNLTDQFYVGYSYDKSYGLNTYRYNQGSHEIVLRYDFIFASKKQINSPRHF